MSENLKQKIIMEKLQEELDRLDEKYPDDNDCAKCFEKLDIYGWYLPNLADSAHQPIAESIDIDTFTDALEDTRIKIQNELNSARDCLDNRTDIEKQAIDSLTEGKRIKRLCNSEKKNFAC